MAAASGGSGSGDHNPTWQRHDQSTPCGSKRGRSWSNEDDDSDAHAFGGHGPLAMDVMMTTSRGELQQRPPAPMWPHSSFSALQPAPTRTDVHLGMPSSSLARAQEDMLQVGETPPTSFYCAGGGLSAMFVHG
jgi:hypothetical protein